MAKQLYIPHLKKDVITFSIPGSKLNDFSKRVPCLVWMRVFYPLGQISSWRAVILGPVTWSRPGDKQLTTEGFFRVRLVFQIISGYIFCLNIFERPWLDSFTFLKSGVAEICVLGYKCNFGMPLILFVLYLSSEEWSEQARLKPICFAMAFRWPLGP